jgi:hypothetical protein
MPEESLLFGSRALQNLETIAICEFYYVSNPLPALSERVEPR